jgi:precorrin-2/cobalt-factor-2 C20-methyltransferase
MTLKGSFTGIGVGPGSAGLITVNGVKAISYADKVLIPRAKGYKDSKALACIRDLELPKHKIVFVDYPMTNEEELLDSLYDEIAEKISAWLREGLDLAYITIGDPYIYSTYIYTVQALRKKMPNLPITTFPGISSFQALAAEMNIPLGIGKERVLILPCPETAGELRLCIEQNDTVVLMKIGDRFEWVYDLISELGILPYCALGQRIGLDNANLTSDLKSVDRDSKPGYLSVMLIKKNFARGRKIA